MTYIFKDTRPYRGQDPFVVNHKGKYLLIQSDEDKRIVINSLVSLKSPLQDTASQVVWEPQEQQIWAPELHQIYGLWFIYYASSGGDNRNHRTMVAGSASDPFGPYHFSERIGPDIWGIDMTVVKWQGKRYMVWSGWENNGDEFPQNLYIAPMISPVEIGERTLLASPYLDWQTSVAPILEGPQSYIHNGTLYLFYSANASWKQEYATGALKLVGDDPLNPLHWLESPKPLIMNAGHGHIVDDTFIYHRKMNAMPGWQDREIVTMPANRLNVTF